MSAPPAHAEALLGALRALGGRATLGDLVARTSLPTATVEQSILPTLSLVGGHVAVDDHGTLLYTIDRRTPLPVVSPWLHRAARAAWAAFQAIFFAFLSIAVVAYAVFYIVLLIALAIAGIAAAAKGGDCDCDCDCGGDACKCAGGCDGCNGCGDTCYGGTCARGRPDKMAARQALRESQKLARVARGLARTARAAARQERLRSVLADFKRSGKALGWDLEPEVVSGKPPFLRAVRDFVFGPPRPPEDPNTRTKNLLGFVRDHQGRMTAMDAAMVTGLPLDQADRVALALAVSVDGDVEATEDGAVVYTFDRFMVSVGSDLPSLEWIAAQGGRVTVAEFARREGTSAADALRRLQGLVRLVGGRVAHGETSVFELPKNAREQLDDAASSYAALRDFTYCWERLERAPAILGVPPGQRGWIWGFTSLNIAVSTGLCIYYAGNEPFLGAWEVPLLGVLPLVLSVSVFLIPAIRALVEAVRNGARRRRNAHHRVFLALAHRLLAGPAVSVDDVRLDLGLSRDHEAATTQHLERLARELEGGFDPARPEALRFERAHRELIAVQRARDELDPQAFVLAPIVYDTASPP